MTVRTTHIRTMLALAIELAEKVDGLEVTDQALDVPPEANRMGVPTAAECLAFAADLCLHAAAELRMEYAAKHGWTQP